MGYKKDSYQVPEEEEPVVEISEKDMRRSKRERDLAFKRRKQFKPGRRRIVEDDLEIEEG